MTTYAPKRTTLTGNEIVLNTNDRARAFWLIQKYTSLAYTRRMSVLFFNFVGGYEDFVKNKSGSSVKFYRDNLTEFYKDQALLTKGLDLLERGYKVGYASIAQGCAFNDFLQGRRFEAGIENQEIGFRYKAPAVGLYAWADVAIHMSSKILTVLEAKLSFPQILNPFFVQPLPASLPLAPTPREPFVRTNDRVPTSGIWQPISVPSGCPNYLWAGRVAPPALRPTMRLDYPYFPGSGGEPPVPAHTAYACDPEPADWQLLWEDHRYEQGPPPNESEYLDPSTDPPLWAPQVSPPS
jgi:Immunity protein 72